MPNIPINIKLEGVESFESQIKSMGKNLLGAFALVELGRGISEFTQRGIREFQEEALVSARLTTALGYQSKALEEVAKQTASVTLYKDDEIQSGQAALAVYIQSEAAIKKLTPVMADMAASGLGMEGATTKIRKAFEASGDKAKLFGEQLQGVAGSQERLNSILEIGNRHVGGMATALSDSQGEMAQFNKHVDDLAKSVGEWLVPVLNYWAKGLADVLRGITALTKGTQKENEGIANNLKLRNEQFEILKKLKETKDVALVQQQIDDELTKIGTTGLEVNSLKFKAKTDAERKALEAREQSLKMIQHMLSTAGEDADEASKILNKYLTLTDPNRNSVDKDAKFKEAQAAAARAEASKAALSDNKELQEKMLKDAEKYSKEAAAIREKSLKGSLEGERQLLIEEYAYNLTKYGGNQELLDYIKEKYEKDASELGAKIREEDRVNDEKVRVIKKTDAIYDLDQEWAIHSRLLARKEAGSYIIATKEAEYLEKRRVLEKGLSDDVLGYLDELSTQLSEEQGLFKVADTPDEKARDQKLKDAADKRFKEEDESTRKSLAKIASFENKDFETRMKNIRKQDDLELKQFQGTEQEKTRLAQVQAEERSRITALETFTELEMYGNYASRMMKAMDKLLEAQGANANEKKRMREGEALMDGATATMGAWKAAMELSYPANIIAGVAMSAVITAETIANIATIEKQQFAYGGIVAGGTPGQDSVDIKAMPGEVVYNPAHPRPDLLAMINGSGSVAGNTAQQSVSFNIVGPTFNITGSPTRETLVTINKYVKASTKDIVNSIKEAQHDGKIKGITTYAY